MFECNNSIWVRGGSWYRPSTIIFHALLMCSQTLDPRNPCSWGHLFTLSKHTCSLEFLSWIVRSLHPNWHMGSMHSPISTFDSSKRSHFKLHKEILYSSPWLLLKLAKSTIFFKTLIIRVDLNQLYPKISMDIVPSDWRICSPLCELSKVPMILR